MVLRTTSFTYWPAVFFGKMSIQILCLFFDWITCFPAIDLKHVFLINFKYESLIRYVICKYFLPFNKLPFHFTYGLLCCAKNFLVWCIPTFIFAFVAFALDVKSKKYHCWSQCQGVYHLCFLRNFMVSPLTFKSLMRVEFVFVSSVRQWPSFILLHAAVQFSLHHLLKRLSFPHYIVLAPLL